MKEERRQPSGYEEQNTENRDPVIGTEFSGSGRSGKGFLSGVQAVLFSKNGTIGLFLLALALLFGSGIGGARAALTYFSETYSSRVQMYDIGVSLLENGERVSWRDYESAGDGSWDENTGVLLANMLEEGEALKPGRAYPEALSVRNSGTINQYVRVSIYKYWMAPEGESGAAAEEKLRELTPDLIGLHLLCDETGYDNGWLLDREASTPERTVLYYDSLLYAEGAGTSVTPDISDTLTIDGSVAEKVEQTRTERENGYEVTTTYLYDGVRFRIEAEVDAVQEHNAEDAILSAWGRDVNISGSSLALE